MSRKIFSDKDDEILKECYGRLTNSELVELFRSTYSKDQIKWRAKALKLSKDTQTLDRAQASKKGLWQEWEMDILKKHYPNTGANGCAQFLPDRSEVNIQSKAMRMGLKVKFRNYANGPKHHSEEAKRKMSEAHKGVPKSEEHKAKIGRSGSLNHNWIDGRSFKEYGPDFNHKLKVKIKKRDNFMCAICRETPGWSKLHVHHIDYDKTNNSEKNLITLCIYCHNKHHNTLSEVEQDYFRYVLGGQETQLSSGNITLVTDQIAGIPEYT